MFTLQHYKTIAEIVSKIKDITQRQEIAYKFYDYLAKDSANFKGCIFLKNCDIYQD
jgi:hypothetical protein